MDYEKKYKEALKRAKEKYTKCYSSALLEYIFPELKESEGERIRKSLVSYLRGLGEFEYPNKKTYNEWLEWLEKQNPNANKEYWRGYREGKQEILDKYAELEKQGEQKQDVNVQINPSEYINDMGGNGCYLKNTTQTSTWSKKEEKVDNQNCVKSVDDIKPKFKVGDWICNDMCDAHIASIEDGMYYFDEGDGLSIVFVDEHYHLWTIEDARDGDVLAVEPINDYPSPFIAIYKERGLDFFNSHCFISCDGEFHKGTTGHDIRLIHPANKEQRDILFQKMKEAGYIFDFKNKELKKIKNEITIPFGAKDSELQEATYFIPKGFYAEIDNDKVVIKKGEKPATWSEEDERNMQNIDTVLFYDRKLPEDICAKLRNFLKTLKERIGWKPSEEQIKAFEHFVRSIGESGYVSPYENNTKLLYSLLEQLKKL